MVESLYERAQNQQTPGGKRRFMQVYLASVFLIVCFVLSWVADFDNEGHPL